jgi:thiol:disulfide interchange protein
MLGVLSVHALEDIVLLSIGRFAPVSTFIMYAVGIGLSWLVFGVVLAKLLPHKH